MHKISKLVNHARKLVTILSHLYLFQNRGSYIPKIWQLISVKLSVTSYIFKCMKKIIHTAEDECLGYYYQIRSYYETKVVWILYNWIFRFNFNKTISHKVKSRIILDYNIEDTFLKHSIMTYKQNFKKSRNSPKLGSMFSSGVLNLTKILDNNVCSTNKPDSLLQLPYDSAIKYVIIFHFTYHFQLTINHCFITMR
jgi:hypothetical protein